MRSSFVVVLAFLGCARVVAPQEGSMEWVVEHYAAALLLSDAETMGRYLAEGIRVQEAKRNPSAAALHVIRLCPQGGDETRQNVLVLIGGNINSLINGIDVVAVKEVTGWRIRDARLSVGPDGAPRAYLRNCHVDPRLVKKQQREAPRDSE
jgi:hypothetical protein